jgi:hypothetical protein
LPEQLPESIPGQAETASGNGQADKMQAFFWKNKISIKFAPRFPGTLSFQAGKNRGSKAFFHMRE